MKGLFLRIIVAVGLMLWAIDMVFPWQRIMQSEENRYSAIQARSQLIVGTINNPISYFIGTEGESGLEYELAKNFADYLGVTLKMETFDSHDELFSALSSNQIDVAAANLLYLPKRADLFQVGPAYTSASWQLVYRKKENRPRNLSEITKPIFIAENAELNQFLAEAYKTYSNLNGQHKKNSCCRLLMARLIIRLQIQLMFLQRSRFALSWRLPLMLAMKSGFTGICRVIPTMNCRRHCLIL